MADQKKYYSLSGSYYYRTVKEADLSLAFSDTDDGKITCKALNLFSK